MINLAEFPLIVHLGGGSLAWGTAAAGWGLGQVIGARLAKHARGIPLEKRTLVIGQAVLALGTLACGLIPSVPVVVVLFLLIGAGNAAAMSASFLVMQRWSPDPVRARSFAVLDSVCAASLGLAIAVAGALLSPIGPSMVFVIGGSIAILALATATRLPPHHSDRTKAQTATATDPPEPGPLRIAPTPA